MSDTGVIVLIVLYIFFLSLGVLLFFNISMRYIGKVTRKDTLFIIFFVFAIGLFIINLLYFGQSYAESRNAKRSLDVEQIADAISRYIKDANYNVADLGEIPFCPQTVTIGAGEGNIDLNAKLREVGLAEVPCDPLHAGSGVSGYTVCVTASSRIEVAAPFAENDKIITTKR